MNDRPAMNDAELIDLYATHQLARSFSARTVERRTWSLGILAAAGPLAEHTPDTIERWMIGWRAPASRAAVLSDARGFYKWAVRRGLLTANPAAQVDRPKVPARAASPVPTSALTRVLAAANEQQRRAVMLYAYAGLRASEIARLDCTDVRRDVGLIVVRSGKGGGDSVVPLHPELAELLPLTGPAVRYRDRAAVSAAIRRAYAAAGVTARPHDLRHSFGTEAARITGGDVFATAELMRHRQATTAARYVKYQADGAAIIGQMFRDAA